MIFLNVPFRQKDEAKSLGARWDAVSKRWYIPEDFTGDQSVFSKWMASSETIGTMSDSTQKPAGLFVDNINQSSFDTSNLIVDESTPEKGQRLSELLFKVQSVLRNGLPGANWVIAEVANINQRRGHYYLELTETNDQGQVVASCRAMIWQSQAEALLNRFEIETGSKLEVGQKVLVLTEASFHAQYGFSLVIQDLDPSFTLGELEQKLNQIRKNLIQKGLYLENKKFTLPKDFFRVAVIAPPEAAGLGDFRADADVLQNHGLCEFKYFYSSFQGAAVEAEMIAALEAVESLHSTKPYDALVVIRGGGAKLDLSALNIEAVAERFCSMKLPVLAGIGHERDNTIIDEVANTRFDTPSKVIAFIRNQITSQANQAQNNWQTIEKSSRIKVQSLHNAINQLNYDISRNSLANAHRWLKQIDPLQNDIKTLGLSIVHKFNQQIESHKQSVDSSTKYRIDRTTNDLYQLKNSIMDNSVKAVETYKQQIIQSIAFVLSSGPKSQLNRGFCIVKNQQGIPITSAEKALTFTEVKLEFTDGIIDAEIIENQQVKKSSL